MIEARMQTVCLSTPRCLRGSGSRWAGLTLIELMVVLAIIALLLAFLLPTVHASREASRRVQCLANIKQLALAVNSYATAHSAYPMSSGLDRASYLVRILPFLDQETLYRGLDLSKPMSEQFPVSKSRPTMMYCQSDPVASRYLGASYFGNGGWSVVRSFDHGFTVTGTVGVFYFEVDAAVRPDHVVDGLSRTAMLAEFLPTDGRDVKRAIWNEQPSLPLFERPVDVVASECSAAKSYTHFLQRGTHWTLGGFGETIYDHVMSPNSRNCLWAVTAGSLHSGDGVNTAFCDGSARFITSTVDIRVWRAMGTRDLREAIDF
jgi:prepilin-type N-terminal cleavage/methylation domain-containing protein/prepilin-type processing-associated H-X9-DG protein